MDSKGNLCKDSKENLHKDSEGCSTMAETKSVFGFHHGLGCNGSNPYLDPVPAFGWQVEPEPTRSPGANIRPRSGTCPYLQIRETTWNRVSLSSSPQRLSLSSLTAPLLFSICPASLPRRSLDLRHSNRSRWGRGPKRSRGGGRLLRQASSGSTHSLTPSHLGSAGGG